MTDDLAPNKPSTESAPIASSNQLSATTSQVGDVVQISGSPGAVVHQTHVTQVQVSFGLTRTDLIFWTLMALAFWVVASRVTINLGLPPIVGQLAAGGVLAGIVWKFFEKAEEKLNDDTKLEIAVWLLGVKPLSSTFQRWPDAFAKVFDRVFGEKHLSWKCFWRSCMASFGLFGIVLFVWVTLLHNFIGWKFVLFSWLPVIALSNVLPDYFSLLETRWAIRIANNKRNAGWTAVILMADGMATILISSLALATVYGVGWIEYETLGIYSTAQLYVRGGPWRMFTIYPAFFTSIWLWLYAGAGFLLKFARRFDKSLGWFNRRFDIEKHPLSSIGLVAGALVALIYWAAVFMSLVV